MITGSGRLRNLQYGSHTGIVTYVSPDFGE